MVADSASAGRVQPGGSAVCVVGLGYVGVPVALAFDEAGFEVVGYDVDPEQVETLAGGTDPTGESGDRAVAASEVEFTADPLEIERAEYVVIAVPTAVDELGRPDLDHVVSAGKMVGEHLSEGTTVVLESTVYPGVTRKILGATIEEHSGLELGDGFTLGHSPERLSPGKSGMGLSEAVKIVSGSDEETLADLAALYETIVDAGVHQAPSIEVAEAAKLVENVQRDLNIAFVNELAMLCERIGLNTDAVLDAAGTKWNFHEYSPGLVGGHCIPVDPLYLVHRAEQAGYRPELVRAGRRTNERLPRHVGDQTVKALNEQGKVLRESAVLVLGLAYKPNVGDVRHPGIETLIARIQEFGVRVVGHDPLADDAEIRDSFEIEVQPEFDPSGFDGIVLATPHDVFLPLNLEQLADQLAPDPVLVDVYGTVDGPHSREIGFAYYTL